MRTKYSEEIPGKPYNYECKVRFDITGNHCLGISQDHPEQDTITSDRVLLSENQIVEMIKFLKKNAPSAFKKGS